MSRSSMPLALFLAVAALQLVCGGRTLLAPAGSPAAGPAPAPPVNYNSAGDFRNLTLPPLPYAYNALEPYIDEATMKIHHDVHNQAYITNLNVALNAAPSNARSLTLLGLNHYVGTGLFATALNTAIENNAGGAWNHAFFFRCMGPRNSNNANEPYSNSRLAKAISSTWGDFTAFKSNFTETGVKRFGSGFAWLIVKADGTLATISTPNQDNPLQGNAPVRGTPVLTLDVWEHSYYLKYNASRPGYIAAWWNVVNWPYVEENYRIAQAGGIPLESY